MSDNTQQLHLAVLGFPEQPDLLGGNGPSAVHQRWFVLSNRQFHQFHPTGPTLGHDLGRESNICLVSVVLLFGAYVAHGTKQLEACINSSAMDLLAMKGAEAVCSAGGDGFPEVVRELLPLRSHGLYFVHSDGSVLIRPDGNGTDTGTGHEAFWRALDRSADSDIAQFRWQYAGAITILAVTLIVWLTMAAVN